MRCQGLKLNLWHYNGLMQSNLLKLLTAISKKACFLGFEPKLSRISAKFILVGGLAAVVQGAPVTTMDVDIVHNRSSENITKLFAFLKSVYATYRRLDDNVIKPKKNELSGMGHALFTTCFGALDVLAVIEEGKTYEDLFKHTVEIGFRGHTIRILDIKDRKLNNLNNIICLLAHLLCCIKGRILRVFNL